MLLLLVAIGANLFAPGCKDKEPIIAEFTINEQTIPNATPGKINATSPHYPSFTRQEIILIDKSSPSEAVKGRRWVAGGVTLEKDDAENISFQWERPGSYQVKLCINPQAKDSVCVVKNFIIKDAALPRDEPVVEPEPKKPEPEDEAPKAVIKGVRDARLSLDGSTAVLTGLEDGEYEISYTINGQSAKAKATCVNKRMVWTLPLDAKKKNKVAVTRLVRSDDGAKASAKVKAEYGSAPPPPPPPPLPPSSNEELGSNFGYASHRKPSNISACLNGDKSNRATMRLSASSRCRALQAYLILEAQAKVKVTWQQDGERPHVKSFNLGPGGHTISLSGLDIDLPSGRSGTLSIQTEGGELCNGLSCDARKPTTGGVLSIDHQGGEVYLMEVQYKY